MKIGKINRLAKAGETVSVRLPDGKIISAKAGNDLRSTSVLVSKTQSGWLAFSSQGELKTLSTQVVNRRPRQATPEIYPIKVLFSVEHENKFEFYIGGDRNTPIKIWELEKQEENVQKLTSIIKATINSTGNKLNDWIVSIQYYRGNDTLTIPEEYQINFPNNFVRGVESSAIITSNNTTIHVGTDIINPIGNGWFAPDAFDWFNPHGYRNTEDAFVLNPIGRNETPRGYRQIGLRSRIFRDLQTGIFDDYRLRATGNDEGLIFLYELDDIFYTTPIGTLGGFEYVPPGGQNSIVRNLLIPNNFLLTGLPLNWSTTKTYSQNQIIGLSDDLATDFHLKAYNRTLSLSDLNVTEANQYQRLGFSHYDKPNYMKNLIAVPFLNRGVPGVSLGGGDEFAVMTSASQDSGAFNSQYSTTTKTGNVFISKSYSSSFARDYAFDLRAYDTTGFFKFPMITSSGFAVQTVAYRSSRIDYFASARPSLSYDLIVIKSSANGTIELLGQNTAISLDFVRQVQDVTSSGATYDVVQNLKKAGAGESLTQKGLDNSAIGHKVEYSWEESIIAFDRTFPVGNPSYAESTFYYDGTDKYPFVATNSDFIRVVVFTVISEWIYLTPIYTGFRTAPLFKAEDILENNKISRVAWSEQDGDDLKEFNIKLDVKTYRIIVDGGTATIPNSSKIKTFKVKNLSPILSQLDPVVADTAIVHSMSCYFN